MEKDAIKKAITPVKRLGLSKRHSSCFTPPHRKVFESTAKVYEKHGAERQALLTSAGKKVVTADGPSCENKENSNQSSNGKELDRLESVLIAYQAKTAELDAVTCVWKAGCKASLLALQTKLIENEGKMLSCRTLAQQLGIWSTVKEAFQDDPDMSELED